jgi:ParB family transcriptional regulator, chromosome partitioning protein
MWRGIASTSTSKDEEKRSAYSAALIESLTTYKSAAIAAELAQNTRVALAAVVYTFAIKEFALDLRLYGMKTCLQISQSHPNLEQAADSPAVQFLGNQRTQWLAQLSGNPADLWAWCLTQTDEALLQFLAFLAARTVNAI